MTEAATPDSATTDVVTRQPPHLLGRQASAAILARRLSEETVKATDPVLLDVVRLLDKEISAEKHARQHSQGLAAAAIASSLALLVSVAIIIITILSHDGHASDAPPLCDSNDCLRFAFLVGQSMDLKASPCSAFGGFVCRSAGTRVAGLPAWLPASDLLAYRWTSSLFGSLDAKQENMVPKDLSGDAHTLRSAKSMLKLCIETASDQDASERNVRVLRSFLGQRNLSWPGNPQRSGVHPLDVVLDLAINWQMPIWFNIHVTSEPLLASSLRIDFSADYNRWWRSMNSAIHASRPTPPALEGSRIATSSPLPSASGVPDYGSVGYQYEWNPEAYKLDSDVFGTLSELADGPSAGREPWVVRLSELHTMTPHLPQIRWVQFLQKHLSTTISITEKTQLLVAEHKLLTTVDQFFQKFSQQKLLGHISRSVVNEFANVFLQPATVTASPAVADELGSTFNDSTFDATAPVRFRCQLQVQHSYGLLLSANHATRLGLATHWKSALTMLNEAVRAAVSILISHSESAANAQGKEMLKGAIKRIQTIRIQMWPDGQILSAPPNELERLYANFPNIPDVNHGTGFANVDGKSSYLEYLLETRRALRSRLGSAVYRDLVGIGGRSHDAFISYDPFTNTVSVGLGAMEEPLFYALGTKAINYGGLVAAFARELITAIDVDDVRFDAEAGNWSILHKIRTKGPDETLTDERRALAITYDAYMEDLTFGSSGKGDQRVVSLEKFSAQQVFFISYCYSLCQISLFEGRQRCAGVVKSFDPFVKAFSCSPRKR